MLYSMNHGILIISFIYCIFDSIFPPVKNVNVFLVRCNTNSGTQTSYDDSTQSNSKLSRNALLIPLMKNG